MCVGGSDTLPHNTYTDLVIQTQACNAHTSGSVYPVNNAERGSVHPQTTQRTGRCPRTTVCQRRRTYYKTGISGTGDTPYTPNMILTGGGWKNKIILDERSNSPANGNFQQRGRTRAMATIIICSSNNTNCVCVLKHNFFFGVRFAL